METCLCVFVKKKIIEYINGKKPGLGKKISKYPNTT